MIREEVKEGSVCRLQVLEVKSKLPVLEVESKLPMLEAVESSPYHLRKAVFGHFYQALALEEA